MIEMAIRTDFTVELPESAFPSGVDNRHIAGTLWTPKQLDENVRVLVCWPGGSYGRDYWDIQIPRHTGYSFAEYMVMRGFVIITVDPLGVGDSGRPYDGRLCTYDAMSTAAAETVRVLRDRMRQGILSADLPPLDSPKMIGVGHSMGGGLVVIEQARFGSYDAICVLGFTHGAKARAVDSGDDAAMWEVAVEQARDFWGGQWDARYGIVDKAPHQHWLNGPDVPREIIDYDNANHVMWPAEPYVNSLHVGYSASFAGKITSPVFLGFGEFDLAEKPRDELVFYGGASDINLFVLPGSYHCHNFQNNRAALWARIAAWACGI